MSETKKSVLFLIHTLGGGGAEKALVNLVKALSSDDFDITVQTVVDTGRYRAELPSHVRYRRFISLPGLKREEKGGESGSLLAKPSKVKLLLAKAYVGFWRCMRAKLLHKMVVRERYDIEIAYLEGICAKIISGSFDPGVEKYAWIHVDLVEQTKSHAVFGSVEREEETYGRFDRIACVSEHVRQQFAGRFPSLEPKTRICHNVIDEDEVRGKAGEAVPCDAVDEKRFTIVSVGRLNHQKGYDRLLSACSQLYRKGFDFDVRIVGTGTARDVLAKMIFDHGMQGRVRLLGYQENPYGIVAAADLYVASSRTEGLSTTVAEALVLGVPVVATDCSGMSELLGDSERGLIVENSTEGLVRGIELLMENAEVFRSYAKAAEDLGNPFSPEMARTEFYRLVRGW